MNVKFIEVQNLDGTFSEYAIIDWGNEEFTSMPKAEYDREYPNGINEASVK